MNKLQQIADDIRELRDSPNHVCPNDKDDTLPCTCGEYDDVIDKVESLKFDTYNPNK